MCSSHSEQSRNASGRNGGASRGDGSADGAAETSSSASSRTCSPALRNASRSAETGPSRSAPGTVSSGTQPPSRPTATLGSPAAVPTIPTRIATSRPCPLSHHGSRTACRVASRPPPAARASGSGHLERAEHSQPSRRAAMVHPAGSGPVRASSSAARSGASAAPIRWNISSACRSRISAWVACPAARAQRPSRPARAPRPRSWRWRGPVPGPAGDTPQPARGHR